MLRGVSVTQSFTLAERFVVVGAAAALAVEQLAADVGVIGAVGALLLQLVQAAAAAAVAQALPLRPGHVLHGLAPPERQLVGGASGGFSAGSDIPQSS